MAHCGSEAGPGVATRRGDDRVRGRIAATLATALLAVFAAVPGAASAQDAQPAAQAEPKPPPKSEAIAIVDVGVESERAKSQIRESRQIVAPGQAAKQATEALPALREAVEEQIAHSTELRESDPSMYELERLQSLWEEIDAGLSSTQATLRDRGGEIEAQFEALQKIQSLWQATREQALELDVSDEVITQVDEVLDAAQEAIRETKQRQAVVLGLQSDIASLSELAASDLKLIETARNAAVGEVLQRDAPAVWSPEFWQQIAPEEFGARLAEHERREDEVLLAYWSKNRERIFVYAIGTVFLLLFSVTSRKRVDQRLAAEEDLAPVRAIFARPIALALLVSFFASLWIFTELVRKLEPLFGLATLLPAVIILRQVLDRPLFPLLTVAVTVYFAHHVHALIASLPVLSRLLFMAEMCLLAGYSWYTLRPSRVAEIPPEMRTSAMFRLIGRGLRLVMITAVTALAAEIAGFGALAHLIGNTLIFSIYAAIVLYGTVRVADGIVAFLLRVRPLRLLGMVRHHRWLVRQRIRLVVQLAAWFIWIRATMRSAELWDDLERLWEATLAAELPFPEVTITVGSVIAAIVVFWGALLLSRFIRFALNEDVFSRVSLQKGRPYAISTLLQYSMAILGFVLGAAALGFDANRATLLTGAFGVGIGFGLQTIVNNFISGIILLTEQPIQVGDTVTLGDVFGEVQRIGIRSSTVRTWQGAEVIVPNADLISQQVINWTLSDRRRRMEIPVGVKYGSDPERVMEALKRAAVETDLVLDDPEPYVLFNGFGDSALEFELRAWTDEFDAFLTVRSAVCVAIAERLAEAGLEVPFPQRDLHVKTIPSELAPGLTDRVDAPPEPLAPPRPGRKTG